MGSIQSRNLLITFHRRVRRSIFLSPNRKDPDTVTWIHKKDTKDTGKGNQDCRDKTKGLFNQERGINMNYRAHRKELLSNRSVRREYDKLLPEYELVRSIIAQRVRKKMSQKEIAIKAGVPQSTIARIENLTHGLPKLTTLKKIADALDSTLVIKLQEKKAG